MTHYEHDFCDAAQYLDSEGITRLAQVLYLFKNAKFENIWWRIENRVHELIEVTNALDTYNIANILRSFSKCQENRMAGSDKLFIHFEPTIIKQLDNFSPRDLSHILYAYSIRNAGNPELYKAFDKRIEKLVDEKILLDYPTVFNMNYYMMFRDNTNRKIWEHMVDSTLHQDDILPMTYYKSFKFSRFFLQHHFPEWDITEYVDKFYYAERYFNQVQFDDFALKERDYMEIKGFLNQKILVYPIYFMTLRNLFNMHFVFNDQKICIQYHLREWCMPFSKQPSEK